MKGESMQSGRRIDAFTQKRGRASLQSAARPLLAKGGLIHRPFKAPVNHHHTPLPLATLTGASDAHSFTATEYEVEYSPI